MFIENQCTSTILSEGCKRISITVKHFSFFLLLLFSSAFVSAEVKTLVLSDVNAKHNSSFTAIKQGIELAYDRIGVQVEWLKIPSSRALIYSNQGRLDGELLRIPDVVENHESLRQVPFVVLEADVSLYCLTISKCRNINNRKLIVGFNFDFQYFRTLCEQRGYQCASFHAVDEPLKALEQNRVDAWLSADLEILLGLEKLPGKLYRSHRLQRVQTFHYLHKTHKDLIPKVTAELDKLKKEGIWPDINTEVAQAIISSKKIIDVDTL